MALTLQEHNTIKASRIVFQPIPWDQILDRSARILNRPLSFDDAAEILSKNFMRFMANSDDVQTWCVIHRLTFTPEPRDRYAFLRSDNPFFNSSDD